MATTRRAKQHKLVLNKSYMGMGVVTIILASILSLFFVVSLFARPTLMIAHGKLLYLDGIIASAIILGAMVWALIEAITPPGGIASLIWRAGIGLILGGAVGAYIGYSFDFAQYIIIPLYQGNFYAQIYIVAILIFGLAVIWDAAWSHKHGYLGQKARNAKKMSFKESGRSKGYRQMIALILGLIFVFLMIPASSYAGTAISSLSDHHALNFPVTSLSAKTPSGNISQASFTSCEIPVASASNTTLSIPTSSIYVNELCGYLPSYTKQNSTGVNVTHYIQTFYLTTNISVGFLSSFLVQDIYVSPLISGNYTMFIGTGNASSFEPLASSTNMNISYTPLRFGGGSAAPVGIEPLISSTTSYRSNDFQISPSILTGNQSDKITFEVQTSNQTQFNAYYFAVGSTSPTLIGPLQLDNVGYVIGTVMTFVAAGLTMPWIDLKPLPGVRGRRSKA